MRSHGTKVARTALLLIKTGTLFLVLSSFRVTAAKVTVRSGSGTQIRSFQPAGYEFPSGYYKRTNNHFMPAGYEFKAGYYRREPEQRSVKTTYSDEKRSVRGQRAIIQAKRFMAGYDGVKAGYYKRNAGTPVLAASKDRVRRGIPGYDFKAGYYKRNNAGGRNMNLVDGNSFYKRGIPGYDFKAGYY